MKILYLITKSNWGGAQKYVYDLAVNMKKAGHDVVVAFGGYGILNERLLAQNIRTINIKNLERDVNIIKEIKVFRNLYKIFKKENPDIIHLNSSKIGASGSFVARLAKSKKIIFTAHGWPFREDRPFWQVHIIKFISWLTIIFSNKVICVSQKDFDDVKKWPLVKHKLVMIHNGIDLDEELKIKQDSVHGIVRIVSIGELHKNKGFEYGLRAIDLLKEKAKDFKYDIISFGGEERINLEKLIMDLNLENYVDIKIVKEDGDTLLKDYDIYFMPSIKEGLPYVLLEACKNYLPIVASDTGGINEIVENYKNGFLVKPKDINALELALERLVKDKKLRQDFGKEARKKVEKDFTLEKMLELTEKEYC